MARKRVINIRHPELTDEQGELLACVLAEPQPSPHSGPKPVPNRPIVEGILWLLRNGGRWKALPEGYPSPSTCWRRLAQWEEQGVWLDAWHIFLNTLHEQGRLDWEERFADGSFALAKKGRRRRKNQERKGYEVDGGGRWSRRSAGLSPRLGPPGRGDVAGTDAG